MTVANPKYADLRWSADENRWESAKAIIGTERVTLGPQASQQWLHAPEHLAMVLSRYRMAAALIGNAPSVLEIGCGEGIGARILGKGSRWYLGIDSDTQAVEHAQFEAEASGSPLRFAVRDACNLTGFDPSWGAMVSLDVIEHVPAHLEGDFMASATSVLADHGVCVIGTPSENAAHLASPQSRVGHVNLYTPERLRALLSKYFHVVQMWGMQDLALHSGHEGMWHYIMGVGIVPRR